MDKKHSEGLVVGIDATNLRRGGGVTHLIEILGAAEPKKHSIAKIVVWGGAQTLAKLKDQDWLEKINPTASNRGLFSRTWWQRFSLSRAALAAGCNVLFVPGGSYAGSFRPIVTMSQTLLPFEWQELRRYGGTFTSLKLLLLRFTQSRSFRGADGVIFLTEYARQTVLNVTGKLSGKTAIVHHGLNPRFQITPKAQHPIRDYTESKPYRLTYVSIIDQYKHQWHVVEAVQTLRTEGLPVVLDLVGPVYPPAFDRLQGAITRFDPDGLWVHYHGAVSYDILHQIYAEADIGVFASSCENLPIILLETMAAGLPVVCSNRGPMPEVLGDAGLYFNPENPVDIADAIRKFVLSPELRSEMAEASFERCQQYSWKRCATHTFEFLRNISGSQQH
jgi:glycosyltransferase involved in cell wall biosynthesis